MTILRHIFRLSIQTIIPATNYRYHNKKGHPFAGQPFKENFR